jgi:hypothetical protein
VSRFNTAFDRRLEGIAIGRCEKITGLEVDDTTEQRGERVNRRVCSQKRKVRLHLVAAISQPHGIDISGHKEGELFVNRIGSIALPTNGSVKSIGVGYGVLVWTCNDDERF